MSGNGRRGLLNRLSLSPGDATSPGPVETAHVPSQEFSIQEHAAAMALVEALRPYCSRWMVELERPEIAREIGLIVTEGAVPAWAVYRDEESVLHFEDLVGGNSYLFGSMAAGLRLVRAVLEAAQARAAERSNRRLWWEDLPDWLVPEALRV